jgi:hypothetical protein
MLRSPRGVEQIGRYERAVSTVIVAVYEVVIDSIKGRTVAFTAVECAVLAMSSGPASRPGGMEAERVTVSKAIEAAPEAVFAVLADPSAHANIDGTGWVGESIDGERIHRRRAGFPDGDVPP